tara:strand:+ start:1016 stop:1282 length:267 start_codon:yes stop_codon:yes gene_type:complete
MDNFDLKKYLDEGKLLKEEQTSIGKVTKSQLKKIIDSSLTKDEEVKKLESLIASMQNSLIPLYKKEGYVPGLADGFRLYSDWVRNKIK